MQAVPHIVLKIVHTNKHVICFKETCVPFNHFCIRSKTQHINRNLFCLRNKIGVAQCPVKTKVGIFQHNLPNTNFFHFIKQGPDA